MFAWLIDFLERKKMVPHISVTERQALEAGTVWIEKDLFSGRPSFRRLMNEAYPRLTAEEQAFIDGPVRQLCVMIDPWEITQAKQAPPHIMQFLREHRFFGLMIPKEHGGHGFSSLGMSSVVGMVATRSITLNSLVVIPNSLGPAELITHYGTPHQKEHYLPRLARGDEIPCFALTEPTAGSDAASLTASGELFRQENGTLAIRLNWNKRYITLAPITTLVGLAFRLHDPENLLGRGTDLGITCGMVPAHLPGVECGSYHDPVGAPFPNGPTRGVDVVVDAEEAIIGGLEGTGKGWQMLMEALSAGRALSLPGTSAAGAKAIARWAGAYAALREQFGMAVGRFEGVEEPLARIAGTAYIVEAARVYTCGAVNAGQKPSVVSAIAKYNVTELARRSAMDGMDVVAGKGVMRGPRNLLADAYCSTPVAITVEGANILTRTLIVFGQGALRCHPYLQREIKAIEEKDARGLRNALLGHLLYTLRNFLFMLLHGLTRGLLAWVLPLRGRSARYARRLKWASATFAFLADLAVVALGPKLKQRGKLTGRFADALSWMYLGTAVLRRYEAEGRRREDRPLLDWSMQRCFAEIQTAFEGIFANFEPRVLGFPVRVLGNLFVRLNPIGSPPSDRLGATLADILMTPGAQRDRLTPGLFIPEDDGSQLALMEKALVLKDRTRALGRKLRAAARAGELPKLRGEALVAAALDKGFLTPEEAASFEELERLRAEILAVDEFTPQEYFSGAAPSPVPDPLPGNGCPDPGHGASAASPRLAAAGL